MSPLESIVQRVSGWWTTRVVMPRWAIAVDGVYRIALLAGAVIVAVLWFQAATRDEEADRNARIQSCSSGYAATYSAWDAEANRLFGDLIRSAATDQTPDDGTLTDYVAAVGNTAELARLRIGLASFSAESVAKGNDFECRALPARLVVEGIPVD